MIRYLVKLGIGGLGIFAGGIVIIISRIVYDLEELDVPTDIEKVGETVNNASLFVYISGISVGILLITAGAIVLYRLRNSRLTNR